MIRLEAKKKIREQVRTLLCMHNRGAIGRSTFSILVRMAMAQEILLWLEDKLEKEYEKTKRRRHR